MYLKTDYSTEFLRCPIRIKKRDNSAKLDSGSKYMGIKKHCLVILTNL